MIEWNPYAATNANLLQHGLAPAMRILIPIALDGSLITYGQLGERLEQEAGFSKIFTTRIGFVAGELMNRIMEIEPNAPLINVLVVNQTDRQPSKGAGSFMADRYGDHRLRRSDAKRAFPAVWQRTFKRAAGEVYRLSAEEWAALYQRVFGKPLTLEKIAKSREERQAGTERDGISPGRRYGPGGEGPEHKALRLWVLEHPELIDESFAEATAETEVDLESGDRVDVVYKLNDCIVLLEVKSRISNEVDLNRGVFQCIKYRAVRKAMDVRTDPQIDAILVTERELPDRIANLLRLHGIRHVKVPEDRSSVS